METLKHELLHIVAAGVMVQRRSLDVLHPSKKYIEKCVSEMYSDGILRRAPHRIVRIGKRGIDMLEPHAREVYMGLSANNAPGNDPSHIDPYVRASEVLCMMYAAGIVAQFWRIPPVYTLFRGKTSELSDAELKSPELSTFILRREAKEQGQREQRMTGTRSSGYLYSPGFCGPVTATMGRNLKLYSGERAESILCVSYRRRYSGVRTPIPKVRDAMIICPDDDALFRIIEQPIGSKFTLVEALRSWNCTGQAYRYIPANHDGARALKFISQHTQDDIKRMLFSEEELRPAEGTWIDAKIGELCVVEACSCNINKLLMFAGDPKVGVVCWDWQAEFVERLWKGNLRKRRIIPC